MNDEDTRRIGILEVALGKTDTSLEAIKVQLSEIKLQLRGFFDGARDMIALEGRVKTLEITVKEVSAKTQLVSDLLSSLRVEHTIDMKSRTVGSTFWRERAGGIVDAAIIAVAIWLLMMWKASP